LSEAPKSKRTAVDDEAADGGAVAADELGGRVHHDVGAVLERPDEPRGGDGVVDDERHAVGVGDLADADDVEPRRSSGLPMDSP
jgi:hypothetical protein